VRPKVVTIESDSDLEENFSTKVPYNKDQQSAITTKPPISNDDSSIEISFEDDEQAEKI